MVGGTWTLESMASSDFHLLVIDDIPTPYRLALLKEVKELKRFRLSILFLAGNAHEKQWHLDVDASGLDAHYVKNVQYYVKALDTRVQFTWGVGAALRTIAPDVVAVGGYSHPGYWRSLVHCRRHGIPLILWSGTTPTSEWRKWSALRWMKRQYVARCDRYFAYGSAAGRFLTGLGAAPNRIHAIYNTSDLAAFRSGWQAAARAQGACDGPLRFVFVGRLTPYKGLQYVLAVMARLKARYDFRFTIIGDGHYRGALEQMVADLGLADRVAFDGYVQQHDLPARLASGDVFVFPSTQEVWGLVVNEALAAGLFVLSSIRAGVTEDLIDPAISGLPIDPYSGQSIEDAVRAVLDDVAGIRARREDRSRWVMRFAPDVVARELAHGAECAWQDKRNRTAEWPVQTSQDLADRDSQAPGT
jgi:glycosyltransferase involved in cell wall biosynthesis